MTAREDRPVGAIAGPGVDQGAEEQDWIEAMVLELRLRDVRGRAVGDAVRSVQAHCADSGESPAEAFGDPVAYAASLSFGAGDVDEMGLTSWVRVLAPVFSGLVGFVGATAAWSAHLAGDPVVLSWGDIGAAVTFVLLVGALIRFLRPLLDRPVLGTVLVAAGLLAMVAQQILWSAPALSLPVSVVGVVALLALAGSVVGLRRQRDVLHDPVVDPVDGTDRYAPTSSPKRRHLTALAGEWTFVICTAVFGIVLWLV